MKKRPKIYELWFSDYDDSSSYQFTHPNNKLKMEFEQDCEDTLREFASAYIEAYDSWIGTSDLIRLISIHLPKRGYIPFVETFENISFGMGGSCIIKPEEYDDDSENIKKLLGEELLAKTYAKNKQIEDGI